MPIELLTPAHEPALEELLLTDPIQNLFLLGMLDRQLDRAYWYGVTRGDRVEAVAMTLGRLTVPFAPDVEQAAALGAHLDGRHAPDLVVGPREASDALLGRWTDAVPRTFHAQRLYVSEDEPELEDPEGLMIAQPRHAEAIGALSRAMEMEDLGRAPADDEVHRAVVRDRIDEGRCWVIERDGAIVFLITAGTRTPFGCQVGGTYVPPAHRGQGLATAGTAGVTRALLEEHPRVTLHVNEANPGAVRVYERVGYRRHAPYRLAILGDDA